MRPTWPFWGLLAGSFGVSILCTLLLLLCLIVERWVLAVTSGATIVAAVMVGVSAIHRQMHACHDSGVLWGMRIKEWRRDDG